MQFPLVPFYFIRHGETNWNRQDKIMGRTDIPLNTVGIQQAKSAQQMMHRLPIDKIESSPLLRASQTAKILNEELNLPIELKAEFMERCWGEMEGTPFQATFLSKRNDEEIPTGAESFSEFQQRVSKGLNEVLSSSSSKLIVAHGGVFMVIISLLRIPDVRAENYIPYCFQPPIGLASSWSICEFESRMNC